MFRFILPLFLIQFLLLTFMLPVSAAPPVAQWMRRYESPGNWNDVPAAVAVDAAGNVIVTGAVAITEYRSNAYTAKYAGSTGALLWERLSPGPPGFQENCSAGALTLDAAGDVIVTGTCYSRDYAQSAWVFKLSGATGVPVWEKRSTRGAAGMAVKLTGAGEVVVAGLAYNTVSQTGDFYAGKFAAASGQPVWEFNYYRNEDGQDVRMGELIKSLALDAAGDIILGGDIGSTVTDLYTVKVSGASGSVLWAQLFQNENLYRYCHCAAVAVDGNGDVIIAGSADDAGTGSDFYTIKYEGVNGTVLWKKRHTRAEATFEWAASMLLDAAGNVIVTGSSAYQNTNYAYAVKHAAADGAVMWTARSPLPHSNAEDAALDGNGDVLMGGSRLFTLGGSDLYCAKLNAASGAFQWETSWDGAEYADEWAAHLALMPDGSPVITATDHRWQNDNIVTVRFGPPPPLVTAGAASAVTTSGATLRGTVNPRGLTTTAQFEFGPSTAYGNSVTVTLTAPAGSTAQNVSYTVTGLDPGTTLHWRLTAMHSNGIVAATSNQITPILTVLQDWRRQHFGVLDNSGNAADAADPDSDRIPNLIEWACGTDPVRFNASPLTVNVADGGQILAVTWPRSSAAAATGAVIGVEWSQSLSGAAWSAANLTQEVIGETAGVQTVRAAVPVTVAGAPRLFARLRVSNAR